jgi:hypothetical protein
VTTTLLLASTFRFTANWVREMQLLFAPAKDEEPTRTANASNRSCTPQGSPLRWCCSAFAKRWAMSSKASPTFGL